LNLDGSQTIAKKGGALVGYQARKKAMRSNILEVTNCTLLIRHDKSATHWIKWHFIAAFLCFAKR